MSKSSILTTAVASAVSGMIGWYVTNQYWKKKNRKEVEDVRRSLREFYLEKLGEAKPEENQKEDDPENEIPFSGLVTWKDVPDDAEPVIESEDPDIYIIKPEEYGEHGVKGWDKISYLYFPDPDKYVNASYDVPVSEEEIRSLIGGDISSHFGEYEDDAVYVRNEKIKADIAVYLSDKDYDYE